MKNIVNIHEAKTNLSRILEEVAGGAQVIIAKAGKPMARLMPIAGARPKKLGLLKGKIKVADDFNASLPEDVASDFEGH